MVVGSIVSLWLGGWSWKASVADTIATKTTPIVAKTTAAPSQLVACDGAFIR